MKKASIYLGLALLIGTLFFALKPKPQGSEVQTGSSGLPWQIQLTENGSEVFGLRPGYSSVETALSVLGEDHDLAIIIDKDDHAGLEIYFSHFKAGPLAAKLILSVAASQETLESMASHADHSSYMASGSRKFQLNQNDLLSIQTLTIEGISFIPAARLTLDIIEQRFGKAAAVHGIENGHFLLYPELGLSITLNEDAKDVLQYVRPSDFHLISEPPQS